MVDWRRVNGLSVAIVIAGALAYVIWCHLSSSRRKKRRADEEPEPPFPPHSLRRQAEASLEEKKKKRKEEPPVKESKEPRKEEPPVKELKEPHKEVPPVKELKEPHKEVPLVKEQGQPPPPPQLEDPPHLQVQQVSPTSEPQSQAKSSESKYILVLGLDGAGKSSILNSLAASKAKHCATPTEGLNALCVATEDAKFEFLELGGSEPLRSYWNMYLSKAHLLIFVVDSADHDRLPLAKQYLFEAIGINPSLPLMVLANKQDLKHAFSITQIHEALSLSEIGDDRKLFLISTHVAQDGAEMSSGLQDAKELISQIVLNTDSEAKERATELANESWKEPVNEAI